MAQVIGLIIEDENSQLLMQSEVNFAEIYNELVKLPDMESKFPILSSVDPYGDTTFNNLQQERVIGELQALVSTLPRLKDLLEDIIRFFQTAGTHQYVKFLGD